MSEVAMIEKIIDYCGRNKFIVILFYLIVIGWGIWSVANTPLDAIPDLSENQVIVFTEWMGRSPQLVEDQITFPLVTATRCSRSSCHSRAIYVRDVIHIYHI